MKNHFVRVLLSWWKAAHYVFSQDTKLYYKQVLQQIIGADNKLFKWTVFVKAIHIDSGEVNNKKYNPRIWFECQEGFEFLEEQGPSKKAEVKAQSFSIHTSGSNTPSQRRKMQRGEVDEMGAEQA